MAEKVRPDRSAVVCDAVVDHDDARAPVGADQLGVELLEEEPQHLPVVVDRRHDDQLVAPSIGSIGCVVG